MAAPQQGLDEAKVEAFMEKALSDISGMMAVGLCHLGDRLGLFDAPRGGREALGPLSDDAAFTEAFPARGRPAISPGALALVSVLTAAGLAVSACGAPVGPGAIPAQREETGSHGFPTGNRAA